MYVACWLRLYDLNSPKSSCSLISLTSYILCGKECNIHWIHWYSKCALGTDLCFFVKSIWLSLSARLHGFVLLSCILFPSCSTSSLYSLCCISQTTCDLTGSTQRSYSPFTFQNSNSLPHIRRQQKHVLKYSAN